MTFWPVSCDISSFHKLAVRSGTLDFEEDSNGNPAGVKSAKWARPDLEIKLLKRAGPGQIVGATKREKAWGGLDLRKWQGGPGWLRYATGLYQSVNSLFLWNFCWYCCIGAYLLLDKLLSVDFVIVVVVVFYLVVMFNLVFISLHYAAVHCQCSVTYLQCFDLDSYLQLNCERGLWRCPVCK